MSIGSLRTTLVVVASPGTSRSRRWSTSAWRICCSWRARADGGHARALVMAVTFAFFAAYGVFAAAVRQHVVTRPRALTWMPRTFAGALWAPGLR
jgi:hypothetical protein